MPWRGDQQPRLVAARVVLRLLAVAPPVTVPSWCGRRVLVINAGAGVQVGCVLVCGRPAGDVAAIAAGVSSHGLGPAASLA